VYKAAVYIDDLWKTANNIMNLLIMSSLSGLVSFENDHVSLIRMTVIRVVV